ncbi:hypothetical protein GQ53DRAFT_381350 [Thozetella sp. PMI_491]|nr:hypothetical protein GQ53DRAFT_381350 [Thozetella sp. PMI_491]
MYLQVPRLLTITCAYWTVLSLLGSLGARRDRFEMREDREYHIVAAHTNLVKFPPNSQPVIQAIPWVPSNLIS